MTVLLKSSIFLLFADRSKETISHILPLSGWMIWKFLTEAWVTRPWKLSTYDWVCSFQLGDLFTRVTSLSVLLFAWRTSRVSSSYNKVKMFLWNILHIIDISRGFKNWEQLTFFGWMDTLSSFSNMPGMITVIFLGPLNPSTFVSWNTKANCITGFCPLINCVIKGVECAE